MAKRKPKAEGTAGIPHPAPPAPPAVVPQAAAPTLGTCELGDLVRVPSGLVGYVAWHMTFHDAIYETFLGLVAEEPGPPEAWSRGGEHGHRSFPAETPVEMLVSQRRRTYEGARFSRASVRDPLAGEEVIA